MKLRSVEADSQTRRIRRRLVLGDAVIISNGQLMSKHDLFVLITTCIARLVSLRTDCTSCRLEKNKRRHITLSLCK